MATMTRPTIMLLIACLPIPVQAGLDYPDAPRCDQVDDFFGTPVPDPYRWLEDLDSPETREWIAAQNALTESFLSAIPERGSLRTRIRELFDYESFTLPYRRGDLYFFSVNSGLQEHYVFCCSDSPGGEPRVLIDPNLLPPERHLSLAGTSVSHDGEYLAWGLSSSGSDWSDWYVTDIETGEMLEDTIRWTKAGWVAWNADDTGFYYSTPPPPLPGEEYTALTEAEKVYLHLLGTPQEEDSLVFECPGRPELFPSAYLTDDERYLVIDVYDGSTLDHNYIYYIDLSLPPSERVTEELVGRLEATYSFVGNADSTFYIWTNLGAPNGMLVAIDLEYPDPECWREVVPERTEVLEGVSLLNGSRTLVLQYSRDACSLVEIWSTDGVFEREIPLPDRGSAWGFGGRQEDTETFYQFTSFLYPEVIYRYDFATGESEEVRRPDIDADLSRFESRQVFYESYDGTMVPMFLVYPRDMALDGANPALMTGYGGFGIPMSPYFNPSTILWLEQGGVFAMPCIRGGGEYGEEWHLAGVGANRENTYDDFAAAAEYLIAEGYTSTPWLGIEGASNGGTLIGACLNRRPDLYGAAVPQMGVMDQLRFHLFTYGWSWTPEYGDPEDPEDFEFLYRLSPYHNIRDGVEYPAVLVTTADHDDRVVPGHSFKYAARLQAAQAGEAPVLIAVYPESGHGGAVGLAEALERSADVYAFLLAVLGGDQRASDGCGGSGGATAPASD